MFISLDGFVIIVVVFVFVYLWWDWGSHLSVRCGNGFRQVLSLSIELQQWREIFAPHSVIHVVCFRVFFWEDVAPLCILCYNVLLPRCPETWKQKQNEAKKVWATDKAKKSFKKNIIWSYIRDCTVGLTCRFLGGAWLNHWAGWLPWCH